MLQRIRLSLLLALLCVSISTSSAQLPTDDGDRMRYNVQIDIRGAYVSGVCSMLKEDGVIKAAIVNEFGVSIFNFIYLPAKDKVKIIDAMQKLDKWYIRRMLKHDLRECIHLLRQGIYTYENTKRGLKYQFSAWTSN